MSALRWLVVFTSLALATVLILHQLERRRGLHEVVEAATAWNLEAEDPALPQALLRESSLPRAQLRLARWLVADALERAAAGARVVPERLEAAEDLARRAGQSLSRSWEAPMLEGAAIYLRRAQLQDPSLFLEAQDWRQPLEQAVDRAPGRGEPARFLAAAYLEVWPALAPADREHARALVSQTLRDPQWQRILTVPWLRRAGSRGEALELLPPNPPAWRAALEHYGAEGDWRGVVAAHEGLQQAQRQEARALLADGLQRLRGGDLRGARSRLLAAVVAAPADGHSTTLVERALAQAPAGPRISAFAPGLQRHLEWSLERSLLHQPALPPQAVGRLAFGVGDMPPPTRALVLLAARQEAEAERLVRRAESEAREATWAPVHLLRARSRLAEGDLGGARDALAWVHGSARGGPIYWHLRRDLGRALNDGIDLQASERRLRDVGDAPWPASSWEAVALDSSRRGWNLTLWRERDMPRLDVTIDRAPARGSVVEVLVDGLSIGAHPVRPGATLRLPLDPPLAAGTAHRVTLLPLFGAPVTPGDAR